MKKSSSAVAEGRGGGVSRKPNVLLAGLNRGHAYCRKRILLHPQSSRHGSAPEPVTRCPCAPGAGPTGSLAGEGRDERGSAIFLPLGLQHVLACGLGAGAAARLRVMAAAGMQN